MSGFDANAEAQTLNKSLKMFFVNETDDDNKNVSSEVSQR